MKWSLFNWKKPVVSSGEPEDYQVVKNTVSQNERNITNINSQITNVNNQLTNTVSTNTNQTITGQKTINAQTTISANPTPLILKANNNEKTYLVFRDSQNNSNFSLGANADGTSFEMNRGHLTIKTLQDNKNVAFERVAKLKLNQTVLEAGTEINAGYGGGVVKFIPEDNSTKTLQFFNNNANDTRRFKLAVPEPVDNNNPATKNYVDTKETAINNRINTINTNINTLNTFKTTTETNISNINNSINELNEFKNGAQGLGLNLRYQDLTINRYGEDTYGPFVRLVITVSSLQETKFLAAVIHYKGQNNSFNRARDWELSYSTTWGPKIYFVLKAISGTNKPDFNNTFIRIFYIDTLNSRVQDPYFLVEEENNEN